MTNNIDDKALDLLCRAILTLETVEECRKFLEDACSHMELRTISQRMVVAKMLSEKSVYSKIIKETGASTATVSRVNKSLEYGAEGYRLVLSRLDSKVE
ncbi:MAG: TrpR-like protein YerC/YecD [Ruminococcaceae bacterium]|nr:TrpR-like protein YerC/YecD [Oscillospiraceae bacterium]